MSDLNTGELVAADKQFVWHPFTNMREWCAPGHEPLVLAGGHGAIVRDSEGREYIDGDSSIWTNIHGHDHPRINVAIRDQLHRVAHTSFHGFTNPPAITLAQALIDLFPKNTLTRVFFSDDGSTAIEAALRMADQYWRLRASRRTQFVSFQGGYHGDTAGAASLGAAAMFHVGISRWNLPVTHVPTLKALERISPTDAAKVAAVVIEPLVQGAAGIKLWPEGTLRAVRDWCDRNGALLIVDEVMTGFGRTGKMFAIEHEEIRPDILVLGKGLTGGYLPLAATLVTDEIFSRFDGNIADGKALAYGHSYTGNQLGCVAALANLEIFRTENVLEQLPPKIEQMKRELTRVGELPAVAEVRQIGLIAGIELRHIENVDLAAAVCLTARKHGLLIRPIRDVIVLMPPLCISSAELTRAIDAIRLSIEEIAGGKDSANSQTPAAA